MNHVTTASFWLAYNALPEVVRRQADRDHELLEQDPQHPSLHLKKAGRFWSVRAGMGHRALAVKDGENFVWFWIGRHDEYERLIKR
jgi:hypothetical protein